MLLASARASHAVVAITSSSEVCIPPPVLEKRRCVSNTLVQAHSLPFQHNVCFVPINM